MTKYPAAGEMPKVVYEPSRSLIREGKTVKPPFLPISPEEPVKEIPKDMVPFGMKTFFSLLKPLSKDFWANEALHAMIAVNAVKRILFIV